MVGGNPQRIAVAGSQQFRFAVRAAAPDRAHGVDDEFCRQAIAPGELRFTCLAAAQQAALMQQLGAGGTMNRPVHATAAEQRRIGGVDDSIDFERGDVGLYDTQCGVYGWSPE